MPRLLGKTMYRFGCLSGLALLVVGGCKDPKSEPPPEPAPEPVYLQAFNAGLGDGTLELNGAVIGGPLGFSISDTVYRKLTYKLGSSVTLTHKSAAGATLKTTTVTPTQNGYFSCFAYRTNVVLSGSGGVQTYDLKMVADTIITPSAGKARIRVARMAPESNLAMDFVMIYNNSGITDTVYRQVKVGDVTYFKEVPTGRYVANFTPTSNSQMIVTLEAGKTYTLAFGAVKSVGVSTPWYFSNVMVHKQ
jgi:hypothetical protein